MTLHVHFVRYEEVASHRGDIPLTPQGQQRATAFGRRFSELLVADEEVRLLHAPTRRTQESAIAIYDAMVEALAGESRHIQISPPVEHYAMRNPDLYVAGERVEMVSSAEALAAQFPPGYVRNEDLEQLLFWHTFWSHADRIGYWVHHADPPGENTDAVARRLLAFAISLLDLPRTHPRRYICVTHSPVLRAFIMHYIYASDPGEPEYGESIDLELTNRELTLHYRATSKSIPHSLS